MNINNKMDLYNTKINNELYHKNDLFDIKKKIKINNIIDLFRIKNNEY